MKAFYQLSKLFGLLVMVIGFGLAAYLLAFAAGVPLTFDLVDPLVGKYPALDWYITLYLGFMGLFSFVHSTAEQKGIGEFLLGVLFGIPMFLVNVGMTVTWWVMETTQVMDLNFAILLFAVVAVANALMAIHHLFRRFQPATINA